MNNNFFSKLRPLVNPGLGWCSLEKSCVLASFVLALRPENTVEIGVWCGQSLIPMALAHKEIGSGTVWAIDPWSANASTSGQIRDEDAEWWNNQKNHDWAYAQCLSSINQNELGGIIRIIRESSNDVQPIDNISLLHCDGNHGEQAVSDIKRFAPKIHYGGVAVLDDLTWSGDGVKRAESELLTMGFIELFKIGTGAAYMRV